MKYDVTDVTRAGATTWTVHDRDAALSRYALLRANPHTRYAQVTQDAFIIRQFVRHADASVENLEMEL